MSAVESRRTINDTINDLGRRVARLERTATGTQPAPIPIRPATAVETPTTSATLVPVAVLTFPRVTRGVVVQVQTRADAGTVGEVLVTDQPGTALPVLRGGAAQTPLPVAGTAAVVQASTALAVPPGPVGDLTTLLVQARRVSGAGTVYCAALAAAGIPA